MFKLFLLGFLAIFVTYEARHIAKRQAQTTYVLPDGASLIVPTLRETFSCASRKYGFYADQDNECKVFHVCVPVEREGKTPQVLLYSFMCGNQTVFDQKKLVCSFADDATPCAEASNFYSVNDNFGKQD